MFCCASPERILNLHRQNTEIATVMTSEQMARQQKSKTMKKTNFSMHDMTATPKITERSRAKEAKARRKENEEWQRVESSRKYCKAGSQKSRSRHYRKNRG